MYLIINQYFRPKKSTYIEFIFKKGLIDIQHDIIIHVRSEIHERT